MRVTDQPEHAVWRQMLQRCQNPNCVRYYTHGARGISVCDRWETYASFIADMGRRPSKLYSIDRIDNDGDYEPGNCRWATRRQQQNNTRRGRYLTHIGLRLTVAEWSRKIRVSQGTIRSRLDRGASASEALSRKLRRVLS